MGYAVVRGVRCPNLERRPSIETLPRRLNFGASTFAKESRLFHSGKFFLLSEISGIGDFVVVAMVVVIVKDRR